MTSDDRIVALEAECAKLRAENETLRAVIYGYRTAHSADPAELAQPDAVETSVRHDSSTTDKVALFRFFFDSPIPAGQARQLASAAITRACARHRTLSFASYDRLFPSQDRLPKGGFGNLISLPLQRKSRDRGACVFVDDAWQPHPDQWAFLAGIERMTPFAVDTALARAEKEDGVLGVRSVGVGEDAIDDPWTLPPSRRRSEPQLAGPFRDTATIVSANMLFLAKDSLPDRLINRLGASSGDHRRVVLATGRFIGEGFDDPRLDTLFLAMPISWRGTLQQYAGRLHRVYSGKHEVRIYDYVDADIPALARMFNKRLRGYRAMGYAVSEHTADTITPDLPLERP